MIYVGDNCAVNKSLCDKIEEWIFREKSIIRTVALVGCASHRLNLAIEDYLTENGYDVIIGKVHELMVSLRTLRNRLKLNGKTNQSPCIDVVTRWG